MIYTSSYFNPETHHGKLIPISRGIPTKISPKIRSQLDDNNPLRWLLAPSKDLLDWWESEKRRAKANSEAFPSAVLIEQYTDLYRPEFVGKRSRIFAYLEASNPDEDETWLCYESAGAFCHRNLALAAVKAWRPDCYGGSDITATIRVGSKVRHGIKNCPKSKWHGTVVEIDQGGVMAFVAWDELPLGSSLEKKHPYKDRTYMVFGRPDPLPIRLLKTIG